MKKIISILSIVAVLMLTAVINQVNGQSVYDGRKIMTAETVSKDVSVSASFGPIRTGDAPAWAIQTVTDSVSGTSKYIVQVQQSIDGTTYKLISGKLDTITVTDAQDNSYFEGANLRASYIRVIFTGIDSTGSSTCNAWLRIFEP